jgi:hypothetical protein
MNQGLTFWRGLLGWIVTVLGGTLPDPEAPFDRPQLGGTVDPDG